MAGVRTYEDRKRLSIQIFWVGICSFWLVLQIVEDSAVNGGPWGFIAQFPATFVIWPVIRTGLLIASMVSVFTRHPNLALPFWLFSTLFEFFSCPYGGQTVEPWPSYFGRLSAIAFGFTLLIIAIVLRNNRRERQLR